VKELERCGGERYRVTINTPGITHNSFTDKPLLEASTAHASADLTNSMDALTLIGSYNKAFFDKYLKGSKATPLDVNALVPGIVTIDRYNVGK
jgi:hypothetical protein